MLHKVFVIIFVSILYHYVHTSVFLGYMKYSSNLIKLSYCEQLQHLEENQTDSTPLLASWDIPRK